jgi:hypothetical protein
MMIILLLLVLSANFVIIALRRRYQGEAWISVNSAFAALVLISSVFLVILSLYNVFHSIEQKKEDYHSEMYDLYGTFLVLIISLIIFIQQFLKKLPLQRQAYLSNKARPNINGR